MIKVYIDMDGTLVVPEGPFNKRKWIKGSREMWNWLSRDYRVSILSWSRGDECTAQKKEWIKREIGECEAIIVTKDIPKATFCKPGDILIDDGAKHRDLWNGAGGVFLHFSDPEKAVQDVLALAHD